MVGLDLRSRKASRGETYRITKPNVEDSINAIRARKVEASEFGLTAAFRKFGVPDGADAAAPSV
jgi:hypothetical protein